MQRHRAASRLTSWVFVAALLLKSAVPLLAGAAAGLQGRATAEVCDVYGVDTSMLGSRSSAPVAEHAHDTQHAQEQQHEKRVEGAGMKHREYCCHDRDEQWSDERKKLEHTGDDAHYESAR